MEAPNFTADALVGMEAITYGAASMPLCYSKSDRRIPTSLSQVPTVVETTSTVAVNPTTIELKALKKNKR